MKPLMDSASLLTQKEMDTLDAFLLSRVPDDAEGDEGILDFSELDGFLTALVSGPNMVMPSVWMSAMWGEYEPVWDSMDEFKKVYSMLMRHMNSIAAMLMDRPEDFEPIFLESKTGAAIVDDWCDGFMRGMRLDLPAWMDGGDGIKALLEPIVLFGSEEGDVALDLMSLKQVQELQARIAPNVHGIHAFWLKQRTGDDAPLPVARRAESARSNKVGRNAPCPCGSGKKFKHCCGVPGRQLH